MKLILDDGCKNIEVNGDVSVPVCTVFEYDGGVNCTQSDSDHRMCDNAGVLPPEKGVWLECECECIATALGASQWDRVTTESRRTYPLEL